MVLGDSGEADWQDMLMGRALSWMANSDPERGGPHLEDVVVQLFSVQGPGHKHFANGVIGGDNLKGPSDVARGQGENHLSGGRESAW